MHILHLYSCSLIFIFGATKSFCPEPEQSSAESKPEGNLWWSCTEPPVLGGRGLPPRAGSSLPGRLTVWFDEWLSLTCPFPQHKQNKSTDIGRDATTRCVVTNWSTKSVDCILHWDPVWPQLDQQLTRKSQYRALCLSQAFCSQ